MQVFESLIEFLDGYLGSAVYFPFLLLGVGVCFTLYLGFINIRGFGLALRHVRGHYHNPQANGEISHFQAVATAISGTVGIGNIGGVAVAISVGGRGATCSRGALQVTQSTSETSGRGPTLSRRSAA